MKFRFIGDIIFSKDSLFPKGIPMKRLSVTLILTLLAVALLVSCASNSFVLVYYENYSLVSDALSFTLKEVPEEENAVIFGAMDGKLGQINYEVLDDVGEPVGALVYRQATRDYAEAFAAETGSLGISGKACSVSSTERIGVYEVSYSLTGNVAIAVWNEDEYSYSLVFTFSDEGTVATTDKVREYAISLISTR